VLFFFNSNCIELVKKHELNFEGQNQVAIISEFNFNANEKKNPFFLIATHLKAKLPNTKIRLNQGIDILKKLELLNSNRNIPVIVCGDFNDTTDSPVATFFRDGKYEDASHKFDFSDAYESYPVSNDVIRYSTMKTRLDSNKKPKLTKRTIDYIYFTTSDFELKRLLEIPLDSEFPTVGLPSLNHPSDHLPLMVELEFKK